MMWGSLTYESNISHVTDKPPLEDPSYEPEHPPVDGKIPEEVYHFGTRTQLRWFKRFLRELDSSNNLYKYYVHSEHHKGPCCGSCLTEYEEDVSLGHGGVVCDGWCCCRDDRILTCEEPSLYVSLPRYTILLIVKGETVVDAPPVARRTIGMPRREVLRYYLAQRDSVIDVIPGL